MRCFTTGLQHIGIPTTLFEQSMKFYQMIGFQSQLEIVLQDTGKKVAFLEMNGLVLELYEKNKIKEADSRSGCIDHLCIDVTDVNLVYEYICKMNCSILDEEIQSLPFWKNGIRFFTIEGPNHEKIEFCQKL